MLLQFRNYIQTFVQFAQHKLAGAFLLVIAAALLEGFGLFLVVPFLDYFSGTSATGLTSTIDRIFETIGLTSATHQVISVFFAFFILICLRSVIIWQREMRLMKLANAFVDHWRLRIFSAIGRTSWGIATSFERTDLEHAITTDIARLSTGTDQLLRGTVNIFLLVTQLIVAFLLAPLLSLIIVGLVALTASISLPLVRQAQSLGKSQTISGRKAHRILGHFMAGLKIAKIHGAESSYVNQFKKGMQDVRTQKLAFRSGQLKSSVLFQICGAAIICLVVLIGYLVLETPLSSLAVVVLIVSRLTAPVISLMQSVQASANMLPAFKTICETEQRLLESARETLGLPEADNKPVRQSLNPVKVSLKHISFRHAGSDHATLDDLSLEIAPGSLVVLSGESGAGKTTLIDIIVGLQSPSTGEVFLNDKQQVSGGALNVAYVQQESFLFDASIRENLAWPDRETVTDEDCWAALEFVQIEDRIRRVPLGLDARTGERGQLFSGGERQRLCLARAILQRPSLLILDEATNALDARMESQILEKLRELKKETTTILITHRPANVSHPDHAFVLRNGKLSSDS